ncbi:MAG: glycosyltransferase [Phycisphaerae bacterium]
MSYLLWIWLGLTTSTLVVWALRLLLLGFINRILPPLHPRMFTGRDGGLPSLSILVAAKDESENIESCLRSLRAQDYPDLEIIAINDRSRDGTGDIMNRLAESLPGLSIGHIRELPAGWYGKNNAMREAVRRSSGSWLCFTDADCIHHSPRCLSIAMRHALEHNADFLSVLPSQQARTFWEKLILPACSAILMLWFSPMAVNNPRRRAAYANGAFMLMRRSCYEAIGGHEAVRNHITEDMELARRAKAAGQRLRVSTSRDLYSVRMYDTFTELWSGWTRIFSGAFQSVGSMLLAAAVLVWFTYVPWLSLAAMLIVNSIGGVVSDAWMTRIMWITIPACIVQVMAMAIFYGLNRINCLYGLIYPLGAMMSLGLLLNGIKCVSGRGSITWRGTTTRGGSIETNPISARSG